jgi:cell division protein FtsI/penicillin-binding protein 2
MAKKLQFRRLVLLGFLLGIGFAFLSYRLVDLQVLRHQELKVKAQANTQREVLLEPRRGDILDAKGNLLATSTLVKRVCADPSLIGNRYREVAHAIATILQENEGQLAEKLTPKTRQRANGQTVTNSYVTVKRRVPIETWDKVNSAMKNLTFDMDETKLSKNERNFYRLLRQNSIYTTDEEMRVYPAQRLASHVLGYTATEDKEISEKPVAEIRGRDGIELTLDSSLTGVRGWRVTENDRRAHELVPLREEDAEPRDGWNVVLTIDSVIQHEVETALAEAMEKHSPVSASAIVVRPRTGEIVAMATLPDYNPNEPGRSSADDRRNRVISDIAEPGSTFKIVVASGALNEKVVSLSDVFNCENGLFLYAGRKLHDHESYGNLTVERIITKSSNIGAAKIGIKMGENLLYDYIKAFGFGARSGIQLEGEISGIVHPLNKWSKVSIAQIPMGQGIAVTRLQMLMAMSAIANKGVLMRPMLVSRLEDRDHKVIMRYPPQTIRQVVTEQTAKKMVSALKTVVAPDGTAPKAALEHYTVAGKTGTAQKVENGAYVHNKFFSSFIGFFPADNPELCISVMLDDPKHGHYGGIVAAPIFKQIAEKAAYFLNIRPEDTPDVPIPDEPVVSLADKTKSSTTGEAHD